MKAIKVQITAFQGKEVINGEKIGSCNAQILISDEAAAVLRKMLGALPAKIDGSHAIDQDDLIAAIAEGHDMLKPVRAQIIDRGRELVTCYRMSKVQTADKDEALEQSFWQDIKDAIYHPALSLDEFRDYQADTIDGEEQSLDDFQGGVEEDKSDDMYYEHYREDYSDWVQSQLKDNYRFVADRIGVDTTDIFSGETDSHIFYAITEIEQ